MSGTPASDWSVFVASCIGAHHLDRDMPNQDSVRFTADGASAIVAVADGHGHHRHFRSARGSDIATTVAISETRSWLDSLPPAASADDSRTSAVGTLATAIWEAWRASVNGDVEAFPFTESENYLRQPGDPAEIAYGSTLLVATVNPSRAVLLQIGDGDMVAVAADSRSWRPVPTDPTLFGNRTTSLAQSDAPKSFRAAVLDFGTQSLDVLLIGTDGFANAQTDETWPSHVGADLDRLRRDKGSDWLGRELPRWAQGSASKAGSGDDTTLALLVREQSSATAIRGGRARRRIAATVGVGALAAAGIAIGLSSASRPAAISTTSSLPLPTTTTAAPPTTTTETITTTTEPPTTTTEIGANHARPLTIRDNSVLAIDPASGRRVLIRFPIPVQTAKPRQAIQVGKFVLVLAGRQLWRVQIGAPRARPATTPVLASPAPPLRTARGRVTMPGRKGLVVYEVTPETMAVRCLPHPGQEARVCAGAVARR